MVLISHRGNTEGPHKDENNPQHIDNTLKLGFDVEIDIWYLKEKIYLGHNKPQYLIDLKWVEDRVSSVWVHCKNIDSLMYLKNCGVDVRYFWHQNDDVTLTSNGLFWTYPGKKLTKNSIACMPELKQFKNIGISYGICSDYITKYE